MYVQSLAVERPIPTQVIASSTLAPIQLTSLMSARYQAVQNDTLTQALYANMSRHTVTFHQEQLLQITMKLSTGQETTTLNWVVKMKFFIAVTKEQQHPKIQLILS
jgi:hypothetical protein